MGAIADCAYCSYGLPPYHTSNVGEEIFLNENQPFSVHLTRDRGIICDVRLRPLRKVGWKSLMGMILGEWVSTIVKNLRRRTPAGVRLARSRSRPAFWRKAMRRGGMIDSWTRCLIRIRILRMTCVWTRYRRCTSRGRRAVTCRRCQLSGIRVRFCVAWIDISWRVECAIVVSGRMC